MFSILKIKLMQEGREDGRLKKSAHFPAKAGVGGGDDEKCHGETDKNKIVHDEEKDGMLLEVRETKHRQLRKAL